jgi:uncharacterized repeat protein (TIGR03803 family)
VLHRFHGTTQGGGSGLGTVFELTPAGATRWTEKVLYAFKGGTDGAYPKAGLIMDAVGTLYGTTFGGGNSACDGNGCGTVFKLSPPTTGGSRWTEMVLHRFGTGGDGF